MTVSELIGLFRKKTRDVASPYLWEDDEIIEYADDAQKEACRRAHLILDSRSAVSEGDVSAGDPMVAISDLIISLRRVTLASNNMPLRRMSVRDMDEQLPGWEGATSTSTPLIYIPDYEAGHIRLFPVPSIDDTLKTSAIRLPISDLIDSESVLEISAKYHRGLLDWMLFRGYEKEDEETRDEAKARKHEALFVAEFGEKSSAVDERWSFEQYQDIGEV